MPEHDERLERELTDERLASERANSDEALRKLAEAERAASRLVERARETTDDTLAAARAKADEELEGAHRTREAITEERAREDQVVEMERAAADEALRRQRVANARLLMTLLPVERDRTDESLMTERECADRAIENRDHFLAIISHDLRDLLGGIALAATAIAKDQQGEQSRVAAERIQRAAGHMARLINDLVDISSIDAGKLAVVPRDCDARRLVDDAVEVWHARAAAKQLQLEVRGPAALAVRVDYDRILQVLGNLILNAVKFSPPGGAIVVGLERDAREVRFSVSDRGPGIPADKLEVIFERFNQIDPKDRRGLGLGLYIARCLVEAHGGRIWAESDVGVGSTFHLTIPT